MTSKSAVNKPTYRALIAISIAMAFLDAFDQSLQLRHMLDAFIYYHGPLGPAGELANSSYWVNSSKSIVYAIQTLLGDAVLVRIQLNFRDLL